VVIYPAIDLLGGACVRLLRGSYEHVTEFSDDPLAMARGFEAAGAPALHVVDLDGAREGRPVHAELILRIRRAVDVSLQVGGGLRHERDVAAYLEAGIDRVILGTGAAEACAWTGSLVDRFGADRIAAAADVRDGKPLLRGWTARAGHTFSSLLASFRTVGVTTVVYTNTARDGALSGADLAGTRAVVESGFRVIAAGGIASTADVRALRDIGALGAVIGSALYSGKLSLADAMEAAC